MYIKELILQTNDLSATMEFYENTMGFSFLSKSATTVSFKVADSILTFEQCDYKPQYHFAFLIPSNQLNEAINWITNRTNLLPVQDSFIADFVNWKAKSIYFLDNNNNILEFIARFEMENASNKDFSIDSILSINEVGLVADHPLTLADDIISKTNVEYFFRGPKGEDFAAVGDENGLFVISSSNRNWYPTQQRAEKWKVKCAINVDGKDFYLDIN